MIELLFSDSACGALRIAKNKEGAQTGGVCVRLTIDDRGESFAAPVAPEPYYGPFLKGTPAEVAGLWLCGSVGPIPEPMDWRKRFDAVEQLLQVYEDESFEEGWDQTAAEASVIVSRLRYAAQSGEKVRIWWSDAPDDSCGFYWAMSLLCDAAGAVTEIKVPALLQTEDGILTLGSTNALRPEHFVRLLPLERPVPPSERAWYAMHWRKLKHATLRAVVNGKLCSVPSSFYDYLLKDHLPPEPCRVAQVIGLAMIHGPRGVNDWWYANRLRGMIDAGELTLLEHKKPFYGSLIARA